MKRLFAATVLLLGAMSSAQAQGIAPAGGNGQASVSLDFQTTSLPKLTANSSSTSNDIFFLRPVKPFNSFETPVVATALALPFDPADPAAPPPKPKFLYSNSDLPRWELGFGFTWIRFNSSIFNASAVGVKTSVAYFTNDWFALEGNISAAYAPEIFEREHVKLLVYGLGPKIAWRDKKWEPWMHAIVGGAHEQPQTNGNSKNAFALQVGGGVDYVFNPRFAGRLEGNYIRSYFFSQAQNNFQLGAGIVVRF
jgi:opacity protein-like surface antigen